MTKKYFCVHHTAVHTWRNQLYSVDAYHRNKFKILSSLGWYVGYNHFIDVDGTETTCRNWKEETAAQVGHNCDVPEKCDTISVCLAGNFVYRYPNFKQKRALRRLYKRVGYMYPEIEITLHRKLQANRTCPGKNVTVEYLEDFLKRRSRPVRAVLSPRLRAILKRLRSLLRRQR